MNKKYLKVVLSAALALTMCLGVSACTTDPPEQEPDAENVNVYDGEGDFEFAKWQSDSASVYTEITANDDGSTFLRYIKSGSSDSYSAIYSKVSGVSEKFGYLNVTVSGLEGKTLLMRIGDSTYSSLLLGTDKFVCVSNEAQTFSWEINASNKWMLGRVEEISLIAEPGQNGSSNVGTMTIYKSWLSETLPEGSFVAKASEWVNGGNYKIAQVGDVTQVGYVGISPNTWQNIYLPVRDHDASTHNTAKITLANTGSSTLYLSVKTVAADNPDESSNLTWDNVILEAGESKTLAINLVKNIRSIVMFVCSADNVPTGIYTGSFTISEVEYTYTDPANVCVWQATSMYTLEKGEGKGTFTYTALKNADWNQNIITTVQHDLNAHNAVSLTVTNLGTTAANYFVKAEGNGAQINSAAFTLEAGESKNVVLELSGQVTAMVVWVNAAAYEGSETDTTAGVFELTNPVFSHEDFFVAADWTASNGFTVQKGDGFNTISYAGLADGAWNQNVITVIDHDATAHNAIKLTITNTGSIAAHYYVKAECNSEQIAGTTFDLAAGESEEIVLNVQAKVEKLVIWVNADAQPTGVTGPSDGSFTVTDPVLSHEDFFVAADWTASDGFTVQKGDGFNTISYAGLADGAWNQNVITVIDHDATAHNAIKLTITNTGATAAHYYVKAESSSTEIAGDAFNLAAGESEEVVLNVQSKVEHIVIWVNADAQPAGVTGPSDGSFTVTDPVLSHEDFFVAADWTASSGFTVQKGDGFNTILYAGLADGAWNQNVITVIDHDATAHNAIKLTITNTGSIAAHYYVKAECNSEQIAGTTFDLAAGESEEVVLNVQSKVEHIVIWVNADGQPAGVTGPSDGSFTVTDPVLSHEDFFVAADWTASDGFTVQKGDGFNTISYAGLADGAWNQNVITVLNHDATAHNAIKLTITNTGATAAHYYVKAEGNSEQIAGTTFDLAAGESEEVVLNVQAKVEHIVIWVNADAQPTGVTGPSDGSFTVTDPILSHEDFFVAADWTASDGFTVQKGDGFNAISYTGLADGAWNQNVITVLNHDATAHNAIKLTITNTGATAAHYYVKAESSSTEIAGDAFDLAAGESEEVVLNVQAKVEHIVIWVNADAQPTGITGPSDGSFTVTDPVLSHEDFFVAADWTASDGFTVQKGDGFNTISYAGLADGAWNQNVITVIDHDATAHNAIKLTITNTGATAAHYYVKAESGSTEIAGDAFDLAAGESKEVVLNVQAKVEHIVIWVNADGQPAGVTGPSDGSFTVTDPAFSWKGTVTAGGAYSATRDEDKITITYTDLTANWGSFVNASVQHNGTDDTVCFTVTNTGTEAVHLYMKLVNKNNEEVKSIVFDLAAGGSEVVTFTAISQQISILQVYINTDAVPAGVENPSSGIVVITNPVFTASEQTGA